MPKFLQQHQNIQGATAQTTRRKKKKYQKTPSQILK
jgi:hypothetical protein